MNALKHGERASSTVSYRGMQQLLMEIWLD